MGFFTPLLVFFVSTSSSRATNSNMGMAQGTHSNVMPDLIRHLFLQTVERLGTRPRVNPDSYRDGVTVRKLTCCSAPKEWANISRMM